MSLTDIFVLIFFALFVVGGFIMLKKGSKDD